MRSPDVGVAPPPQQVPGVPPTKKPWTWTTVAVLGCGCGLLLLAIPAAILFPVFSQAKVAAQQTECLSRLKNVGTALLIYATDNDDRLPAADRWTDAASGYFKPGEIITCPTAESFGYAMNLALSAKKIVNVDAPGETALAFDADVPPRNGAAKLDRLPNPPRHGRKNVVVYLDGSARAVEP